MSAYPKMSRLKGLFVALFCVLLVFSLPQSATAGFLTLKVKPGRAGVFVDGKYVGPAANFRMPMTYFLPSGEHELLLTEPRYKDVRMKITLKVGETTVVEKSMEPLPKAKPPFARLRIVQGSSGKFGAIFLNGKYMGHLDEFSNSSQALLIQPGEYILKITSADFGIDHVEKITLKENETTTINTGSNKEKW